MLRTGKEETIKATGSLNVRGARLVAITPRRYAVSWCVLSTTAVAKITSIPAVAAS